jgi:RimJ/RimL family protein N-acetyltransferase
VLTFPAEGLSDGHVRLEPWSDEHLDFVVAAVADDAIVRWSHLPEPFDESAVRRWFDAMPGELAEGSAIRVRIADATDGKSLGAIALFNIRSAEAEAELGYWISREARGRGVAGRAIHLLMSWAFEALALTQIEAIPDATNESSKRVLERCGFVPAPARADADRATVRYVARGSRGCYDSGPAVGP